MKHRDPLMSRKNGHTSTRAERKFVAYAIKATYNPSTLRVNAVTSVTP